MENPKESGQKYREIAEKYEHVLRARMSKLKEWGATSDEMKEIYKRALQNLAGLHENSSNHDKAAAIEKAVRDALGPTRYEVITTQSRMRRKVKFRIKEVFDEGQP